MKRVFLIVLDSFGIGALPDAKEYGDGDCNTLRSIASCSAYLTPNLQDLGLFNIDGVAAKEPVKKPLGAFAKMTEVSKGKDTTIGHWEIAGVISETPLPTYPDGFPPAIIDRLEREFGRKVICNQPYSGTAVIHDYGREHLETGALIIYTSADSVLQIAAHEEVVPLEDLYEYCKIARTVMHGEHAVGRIIARPFVGQYPHFERTANRHDFSLEPPQATILDALAENNLHTIGIGKISDIFAGRGIHKHIPIQGNEDGMNQTLQMLDADFEGLCFVNLVDFDMKYGHRNDVVGYAKAATAFDRQLGEFMQKMHEEDVLMITADHGCDPMYPTTDHTREYTPLLVYGKTIQENVNLGVQPSFACISATIADLFGIRFTTQGVSFLDKISKAKKA